MPSEIRTTKGEVFSSSDSCDLAWMIYRRFGRHYQDALVAWRRLLQNNCTMTDFVTLVENSHLNDEV